MATVGVKGLKKDVTFSVINSHVFLCAGPRHARPEDHLHFVKIFRLATEQHALKVLFLELGDFSYDSSLSTIFMR